LTLAEFDELSYSRRVGFIEMMEKAKQIENNTIQENNKTR